ncbi:MAG TPA: glycosyltransferase family 9 protein [bacterium]|nr:glycosyltransferase family 9 protein [bacterium]
MKYSEIKFDCRFFRGDIPCKPNKLHGKICNTCDQYQPISRRILIIKLGAIGDVIRTTPLVVRYHKMFPNCHVSWITHTPEVVPSSIVDKVYKFDFKSVYALSHQHFDIAINLDRDIEACALLNDVHAKEKFGFGLKDGHAAAENPLAEHKFITGAFDSISRANTKNYLEEIFEICGLTFEREPYILDVDNKYLSVADPVLRAAQGKKIIGLNTGCGDRWLTRLWPEAYWVELIQILQMNGFFPLLLGGPAEDAMNKNYAKMTGAYYPGTFTLQEFIALSSRCDVVLTAVSMMMHIAIATRVPLVLFNNIFNPHEFELYDNGIMVQPATGCDCYFGNTCSRTHHCMLDIPVDSVYQAIVRLKDRKA